MHHDVGPDGRLWARARPYKASLDPSGFSYTPFLGSDAARSWPVHFRLAHVARGEATLELPPLGKARRAGDRLVLERGPVEVRYDLSPEHAEQSFAFNVPMGTGDLRLLMEVETDLVATPRGDGFRFATERGGVDYGGAVIIDADGQRAAVRARWTGSSIELTVPDAFLRTAQSPVVVDPILSTFAIDDFAAALRFPDVAYDANRDRYFVVYAEQFAGQDNDVYSVFVDAANGSVSGGTYVDVSDADWEFPATAILRGPGRIIVVAVAPSVIQQGSDDIVARMRDANGAFDPAFILKGARPDYSCWSPDVGGESVSVAASNFCVTYARDYGSDSDAAAILLDADGNYVGSELTLASSTSRDEHSPRVAKSTGDPSGDKLYRIAWSVRELGSGLSKVDAVRVSYDGSFLGPRIEVAPFGPNLRGIAQPSAPMFTRHPVNGQQYWIVGFQSLVPGPSTLDTVTLELALLTGDEVLSTAPLLRLMSFDEEDSIQSFSIAATRETFQLAYGHLGTLATSVLRPVVDRLGVDERRLAGERHIEPQMASAYSGGGAFDRGSLIAAVDFDFSAFGADIFGTLFESFAGPPVAGYQFCTGARNSAFGFGFGFVGAYGDRSTGSAHTLVAEGLPPNTLGMFLSSLAPGLSPNPFGTGNLCLSGGIGRFPVFATGANGNVQWALDPNAIPTPSGPTSASPTTMGPETWYFQAWHRDTDATGPISAFTNGVAIPFR